MYSLQLYTWMNVSLRLPGRTERGGISRGSEKNWQQPLPVQIHDKMGQGKEEEGQGV